MKIGELPNVPDSTRPNLTLGVHPALIAIHVRLYIHDKEVEALPLIQLQQLVRNILSHPNDYKSRLISWCSGCGGPNQCFNTGKEGHSTCRCSTDSYSKYHYRSENLGCSNLYPSQTASPVGKVSSPGVSGSSTSNINGDMYIADGDYIKDIEVNDLRNRYTLTKGATQKMVNILVIPTDRSRHLFSKAYQIHAVLLSIYQF